MSQIQNMTGRLAAIALRPERYKDMVEVSHGRVLMETGLEGDHSGKRKDRLISILSRESWEETCESLSPPVQLPWLTRRANLLVEGIRLPRSKGAILQLGPVHLEITHQTYPCGRMENAQPGLLKALAKDWRGGVLCKILKDGTLSVGDTVEVLFAPPEKIRRLP